MLAFTSHLANELWDLLKDILILYVERAGTRHSPLPRPFSIYRTPISVNLIYHRVHRSEDLGFWGNLTDESWYAWVTNESSWYVNPLTNQYITCGNTSGAGHCPEGTTCLQGFGPNPNYGYTKYGSRPVNQRLSSVQ